MLNYFLRGGRDKLDIDLDIDGLRRFILTSLFMIASF
jgi:hypothetical protein